MLNTPDRLEVREEFVDMIRKELLGPAGGADEIVTEPTVRDRFAVGLLAPLNGADPPYAEDERGKLATDKRDTPDMAPALIRRKLPDGLAPAEVEDNIMRMIYCKQVEFAIGHGIAVDAELAAGRWDAAQRIQTDVLPRRSLAHGAASD